MIKLKNYLINYYTTKFNVILILCVIICIIVYFRETHNLSKLIFYQQKETFQQPNYFSQIAGRIIHTLKFKFTSFTSFPFLSMRYRGEVAYSRDLPAQTFPIHFTFFYVKNNKTTIFRHADEIISFKEKVSWSNNYFINITLPFEPDPIFLLCANITIPRGMNFLHTALQYLQKHPQNFLNIQNFVFNTTLFGFLFTLINFAFSYQTLTSFYGLLINLSCFLVSNRYIQYLDGSKSKLLFSIFHTLCRCLIPCISFSYGKLKKYKIVSFIVFFLFFIPYFYYINNTFTEFSHPLINIQPSNIFSPFFDPTVARFMTQMITFVGVCLLIFSLIPASQNDRLRLILILFLYLVASLVSWITTFSPDPLLTKYLLGLKNDQAYIFDFSISIACYLLIGLVLTQPSIDVVSQDYSMIEMSHIEVATLE